MKDQKEKIYSPTGDCELIMKVEFYKDPDGYLLIKSDNGMNSVSKKMTWLSYATTYKHFVQTMMARFKAGQFKMDL